MSKYQLNNSMMGYIFVCRYSEIKSSNYNFF